MKKFIIILLLLTSFLFSKTFEASYQITYGAFLDLGIAKAKLNIDENKYLIEVEAKTTGIAKYLTNNRIEKYKSEGRIIDNKFFPNKFEKIKKDNLKSRIKKYNFDYKKKKIFVKTINEGIKKEINNELKLVEKTFHNENLDELKFFANNDLLSLFFNLNKIIAYKYQENYTFTAVGANKNDGKINLLIPSKNKSEELNQVMEKPKERKLIVTINQKIFGSEKGELLLSLNNEGFCTLAILKDVVFFGDIVGKMIDFKR